MKPTVIEKKCLALIDARFRQILNGHLLLSLPDGQTRHYGDSSPPECLRVNSWRFFVKLVTGGSVGFGEAWVDADCDCDNLPQLLELFINNSEAMDERGLKSGLISRVPHLLHHFLHRNTRKGSLKNIHAHYDLGNDFYRLFLDHDTMMYSCAFFQHLDEPLASAQKRKLSRIIQLAALRPEHHILEIGCGWGGFAIEAAKQSGCQVTAITISAEQYALAAQRVIAEKLEEKVRVVMCDYRDMTGSFDRIVSIEMLEAVGHAYYGTFFAACDRLLNKGGRVVLQTISIPDQRYNAYRLNPDWIQQHIFPGGMLPSLTELCKAMTRHSLFTVEYIENIGLHYAETLRRWRAAFEQNRQELLKLSYDANFQRKWLYYLCYCEAGFQRRFINDIQIVLTRPVDL
ncbi:MAG: cyclopropane-fatty-acyl-phospholipid synthase [Kiritimatiellae bacterium]|nr:cyclopropane-fatty-acyl-phospholipid synthase [Kiritimatiellia bacterium]